MSRILLLPNLLKRQKVSSFNLFIKEKSPLVSDKKQTLSEITQLWKQLSSVEKQFYEDKAKKQKQVGVDELQQFFKEFPPEELKVVLKDFKIKKIYRKAFNIKTPLNSYNLFVKEKSIGMTGMTAPERIQKISKEWNKLNVLEKQKYVDEANDLKKTLAEEV